MTGKILTCLILTALTALMLQCDPAEKENRNKYYTDPYPPAHASKFIQLPVGAVRPGGWIRKELEVWAEGITGHLHEYKPGTFWDTWDNRRSRSEVMKDSKGKWWPYEQQAYWADGIFQLAYILDDERLKAISDDLVDKILAGQNPDGYFGGWPDDPYSNDGDIYTQSLISLALISYHSATGDRRILASLKRAFRHISKHCAPVPDSSGNMPLAWRGGSYGWPSPSHIIYPIMYVYSKTGDRQLFQLAETIYKTGQEVPAPGKGGVRSDIRFRSLLTSGNTFYDMHGVDAAEVLRIPAVMSMYKGREIDLKASIAGVGKIERYCNQAHGGPVSDEQLREPGATNSTETCTQSTWSSTNQTMFAITGDVRYADNVEKVIFNIGPGSRKPDGRAIQYYSAPNQVACTDFSNRAPLTLPNRQSFRPDGDPTTPCCIGQSNRLYPNFVKDAMWMASVNNGLAAVCYGPCSVTSRVGKFGQKVTITEKTNYPFEEKIIFTIDTNKPVKFPLYLRIPGWCSSAVIRISGEGYEADPLPGEMIRIMRTWNPGDSVELSLPMKIQLSVWNNSSVAVERGPLVYALKIEQKWEKTSERFPGFPDWKCLSRSDWNYALCFHLESNGPKKFPLISLNHPLESYFTVKQLEVPENSYPWEYPPVEIICTGKKVDNWKLTEDDVTPDVPQSPVISENPEEQISLVPFGCAPVRITYFPVAEKKRD